jgi:Asp/Glu/hydantoin racemase
MSQINDHYGFNQDAASFGRVYMPKGQNIGGFPIGIIYIDDVWYPYLPGNVVNGYTYQFPVRLKAVEGLDVPNLFAAGDAVFGPIMDACRKLELEGVRAISSACGFFGNFHKRVAEQLSVPVALSSLVQIPWIAGLIGPTKKIGVLTADSRSVTPKLLDQSGIPESLVPRICLRGMETSKDFSCVITELGTWDSVNAEKELVDAALELLAANPDIGAFLLECSDMPPHAHAIQRAVGMPVFDFTTLIRYLHSAVCQTPYAGWI